MTKTATLPHVGLAADELLKLRNRAKEDSTAPATFRGHDSHGLLVTRHFADCDIDLYYRKNYYRVAAIHLKEVPDGHKPSI